MQKKHNALFLIMGLISLIFTGYALFETVFNQIIKQNEGFFYAIVFGGILILLYLFINIICKLLDVSDSMRNYRIYKILYIIIVLALCVVFVFSRLQYRNSVSASESTFYNAAVLINNGSLNASGNLKSQLLVNPAQYVLSLIFSVLLRFGPDIHSLALYTNIFFCCLSSFMVYFVSAKYTDTFCAVIAAALSLLAPGQMFSVYTYSTDCMVSAIFFIDVFLLISILFAEKKSKKVIYTVLYAVISAFLLLSEPTLIILLILTVILVGSTKEKNFKLVLISTFVTLVIFALLLFVKSYHLGVSYGEVVGSFIKCFVNTTDTNTGTARSFSEIKESFESFICSDDANIENTYNYLFKISGSTISALSAAWIMLSNQMLFMFLLVLCISAIFSALQYRDDRFASIFGMLISAFCTIFFASSRENSIYFYHSILAVLSSCGLFYIYLNHHPDEAEIFKKYIVTRNDDVPVVLGSENIEEEEILQRKEEEFLARANALIFIDDNDNLYNMIKAEEKTNANTSNVEKKIENNIEDADFVELNNDSITVVDATGKEISIETEQSNPVVTYIPNPLPVPVRRPHVDLEFDFDVSDDSDFDYDFTDEELSDSDY